MMDAPIRPVAIGPARFAELAYLDPGAVEMHLHGANWIGRMGDIQVLDENSLQAYVLPAKPQPFYRWLNGSTGTMSDEWVPPTRIVTVRGTEPNRWEDWKVDFDFNPIRIHGMPGMIHKGFYYEAAALIRFLLVRYPLETIGHTTLTFTGHSLGGAIATLAAYDMAFRGYKVVLYTFGAPRVGNREWAKSATHLLQKRHRRSVHNADIVPRVPPAPFARHAGVLQYINRKGQMVIEPEWWYVFLDRFLGRIRDRGWDAFRDHAIANYVNAEMAYPEHYASFLPAMD